MPLTVQTQLLGALFQRAVCLDSVHWQCAVPLWHRHGLAPRCLARGRARPRPTRARACRSASAHSAGLAGMDGEVRRRCTRVPLLLLVPPGSCSMLRGLVSATVWPARCGVPGLAAGAPSAPAGGLAQGTALGLLLLLPWPCCWPCGAGSSGASGCEAGPVPSMLPRRCSRGVCASQSVHSCRVCVIARWYMTGRPLGESQVRRQAQRVHCVLQSSTVFCSAEHAVCYVKQQLQCAHWVFCMCAQAFAP